MQVRASSTVFFSTQAMPKCHEDVLKLHGRGGALAGSDRMCTDIYIGCVNRRTRTHTSLPPPLTHISVQSPVRARYSFGTGLLHHSSPSQCTGYQFLHRANTSHKDQSITTIHALFNVDRFTLARTRFAFICFSSFSCLIQCESCQKD